MRPRDLPIFNKIWPWMVKKWPKMCVKIYYYWMLKRRLNLKHPKDLNEKIQWLKFHADMYLWSKLADKYEVRNYVHEKGLDNILVKLYGCFHSGEEVVENWDLFPNSFVIKSNNGCSTVLVIKNKTEVDKEKIVKKLNSWLLIDYGTIPVELHYNLIKSCLIVEEFLYDPSISEFSNSLIDYKIWCFNGIPNCILVIYDRGCNNEHGYIMDLYDVKWNRITEFLSEKTKKEPLSEPKNLDLMLKYASILSAGHPQMRVDLYNIDGRIYFGELTMSSMGGYMDYFTREWLLEMGDKVDLSLINQH